MNCENIFCIYENDGSCALSNVDHDIIGNCSNCIYINIPNDLLKVLKSKSIEDLENKDW